MKRKKRTGNPGVTVLALFPVLLSLAALAACSGTSANDYRPSGFYVSASLPDPYSEPIQPGPGESFIVVRAQVSDAGLTPGRSEYSGMKKKEESNSARLGSRYQWPERRLCRVIQVKRFALQLKDGRELSCKVAAYGGSELKAGWATTHIWGDQELGNPEICYFAFPVPAAADRAALRLRIDNRITVPVPAQEITPPAIPGPLQEE